MRVLVLSNLYPPVVVGGAERYAATLAERVRAAGHEVGVVTLGLAGSAPGPDVVATVGPFPPRYAPQRSWDQPAWRRGLFHLADLYNPLVARTLRRAIADFRPDVVHSHAVQGLSMAALVVPARLGVAHVHSLHDYWLLCQRNSLRRRDGRPCQTPWSACRGISVLRAGAARFGFADVVLSPSDAVVRAHERFAALPPDVRVVRHATETVAPPPGRPDRPLTFGYLGQVTSHKGVDTLLEAFGRLPGDHALLVAGPGPLVDDVRQAGGRVGYLGVVGGEAREAFFASIDCLVVPSNWPEPASLVISEAKARRVPVIGSDLGGTSEYVPSSCRPLVFRAGDAAALERSLAAFASGGPERFGVVDADLRPTWEEHLDGVLDAYGAARRARYVRSPSPTARR